MKTSGASWIVVWAAILFNCCIIAQTNSSTPAPGLERFYIGSYSGAIYQSSLNLGTAAFGTVSSVAGTTDPSFLAFRPDRKFLYSVNEGADQVSSFSVNPTNGTLKALNHLSSGGGAPAYITVDRSGRNVIVANYNGGSVYVFPIQSDGSLGATTSHIQHPGAAPHPHCVTLDASNHFAFVCDKGLDQIRCYILDATAGTLSTNSTLITSVKAGSGPRHLAFDSQFQRAYLICELASTVIGFNFDATNGVLNAFQTISTVPTGTSANTTAEIVVHPSGKFLYGSNRGYNTVVVYTINPTDGTLALAQQQTTGTTPRNFAIDPTGAYCIVAGQDSGDIRLYSIDAQTGLLTSVGKKLFVTAPVCVLPFLLTPPQPVLGMRPTAANSLELGVGNGLGLLTYQIYHSPTMNLGAGWDLLMTGLPGQTNFVLTNTSASDFFRVGVLTNY